MPQPGTSLFELLNSIVYQRILTGWFLLNMLETLQIQTFKGTCDAGDIFIHHMGVTLCGFDVRMPHEFLEHSNIDTILQHGGSKAVTLMGGSP